MNEAELLFSQVLGLSRPDLYLKRNAALEKSKSLEIAEVLKRRINGEPLAYILGKIEFMGLDFKVTPEVLIPRQETEILVDEALRIARGFKKRILTILDIGTGSGCIAIALAKNLAYARIDAIDISPEALKVAQGNAREHEVEVNFVQSNLFENNALKPAGYDLIISNPPYVATSEIDQLAPEVRQEPWLALEAGHDGLAFYRRIACNSARYLKDNGYLMLEMGFNQHEAVRNIFEASDFKVIKVTPDYQDINRVIIMQRKVGDGQVSS